MSSQLTLDGVVDWFTRHQPLLLVTHVTPDGDGLGSQAGLYHSLTEAGMEVDILNHHAIPHKFRLLNENKIYHSLEEKHKLQRKYQGVIICDTNDWSRIGGMADILEKEGFSGSGDTVLYVDHHVLQDQSIQGYVREQSCATGELVYEIIEHLNLKKDKPLPLNFNAALGVYVAILTDTGSFQFHRTNKRVHDIAGACLTAGVIPYKVYTNVYGSAPYEKLLFEAEVYRQAKLTDCKRVIYVKIPKLLRDKYGMSIEDTQGLVGRLRMVRDVEICMLARDEDGKVKISLRSKGGGVEVIDIAKRFAGGGHRHAAGFMLPAPLDKALQTALDAILEQLGESKAS